MYVFSPSATVLSHCLFFYQNFGNTLDESMVLLGFTASSSLTAHLVTPLLFLGPLYVQYLCQKLPSQAHFKIKDDFINILTSWQGFRNFVVVSFLPLSYIQYHRVIQVGFILWVLLGADHRRSIVSIMCTCLPQSCGLFKNFHDFRGAMLVRSRYGPSCPIFTLLSLPVLWER